MNTETDGMKIYRPAKSNSKFAYAAIAILSIAVIFLGIQNYSLRSQLANKPEANGATTPTPSAAEKPEDITLTQQNPTEDWRIYRNLTYNYKFRTPKAYLAKVNNNRNSVEIFNEGNQRTIEISAEPKSDTNTGEDSEKKQTIGNLNYNIIEFPDGNQVNKTPFVTYKTHNDRYVFSISFFNSLTLDEMEKLILATFSEIE